MGTTVLESSKKKKNQREQTGQKKERMRVLELSWDLNGGEKEKEGGGDRDRNVCGGDRVEKKNPIWEMLLQYFYNKF